MTESGAIHARLRAHGLLDEAMVIVSKHACGVGVLSRPALAELLELMVSKGWSETNARRLLGVPLEAPETSETDPFHVEQREVDPDADDEPVYRQPPAPKSKKRLVAWRKRTESGVHPAVARVDDVVEDDAPEAEPIAVPLEKGQRRRTRGGKIITIVQPRTSAGRALVLYASGNVVEFTVKTLEVLDVVGENDEDRGAFAHLPLEKRPKLFAGSGDKFEACIYYGDCLDRMLQAYGHNPPTSAHCPRECTHRRELNRAQRAERATTGLGGGLGHVDG